MIESAGKKTPGTGWLIRRNLSRAAVYGFLILVAFVCLLPFYSMLVSATHTNTDIARKLLLLPGDQFLENYNRLVSRVPIWRGFLNSVFVTTTSVALLLYFSALVAFGFSKYRFKGSQVLFLIVLGTLMIPGQLGIIGFFKLMGTFGMLNTYWPLILPSIANAFGVFFMKQMCDATIPDEVMDAARIDGCGELRLFHRIALPMLVPALATLGIFSVVSRWNDFLMPLIIIFDNEKQLLPVMIAYTKGQFSTDFGAQYVGILLSVIPILVVFSIASKKIMSGITAGSLKG
jgi:multiple sugar transport system permease protein